VVRVDHPTPLFLRKPLVYESMHAIGIEEAKYLPLREKSAAANAAPTAIKDGPYRDLVSILQQSRQNVQLHLDDKTRE
jgi:hypothetical protein